MKKVFRSTQGRWLVLSLILAIFLIWRQFPVDHQRVMDDFMFGEGRMESQLIDPLRRAGPEILPFVLEAIKDKSMPRRRYAIAFIEDQRYDPAVPYLVSVLKDESEKIYFRFDALAAIHAISPEMAEALAPSFVDAPDWLGRYARNIRDGLPLLTLD